MWIRAFLCLVLLKFRWVYSYSVSSHHATGWLVPSSGLRGTDCQPTLESNRRLVTAKRCKTFFPMLLMFLASCSELFLLEWYDLQCKNHRRKIVLLTSQQHWQQRPQQLQRCHLCISHLSCAWRVLYIPRPYLQQFHPCTATGNAGSRMMVRYCPTQVPGSWFEPLAQHAIGI